MSGKADSVVHYLPCKIDHSGPTDVASYFLTNEEPDGSLRAQFRGRGLHGEVLELSKQKGLTESAKLNVRGLVVAHSSNNPQVMEIEGQFDQMHVWQHDRKPEMQEVGQYIDHMEIAQTIHEM